MLSAPGGLLAAMALFCGLVVLGCEGSADVGSPAPADTHLPVEPCDASGNSSPTEFLAGLATLAIKSGDTETASLDRLANSTFLARFDPSCPSGAQAEWTDPADRWLFTVLADSGPNDAFGGQLATMWIEDYGVDPPLFADGTSCVFTAMEVSAARLKGHAECRGLRWLNGYEAQTDPGNVEPIPGLAAFDLSVTFEAHP